MTRIRLYYSIVDPYPAYRVDLVELFARELPRLGLDTEWFMQTGFSTQVGARDAMAGQTVHQPPAWSARRLRRLAYWAWDCGHLFALALRRDPPDVIQCRDKFIAPTVAWLVARLRGRAFVVWCSYPFPEHAALMAAAHRSPLLRLKALVQFHWLYGFLCRRADRVVVQSAQMLEDMAGHGVPRERMQAVTMGVAPALLEWAVTHQAQVVPGRVLYLGTLAAARRLETLIEAFAAIAAEFPQAELWMVGDGDLPQEREALQQRAAALGLAERVRFTGFVPMQEAWRLTASAAVCVSPFHPHPVLRSTSPTKLLEYLALGRPVLCNAHPEQSRITAESGAGLCVDWSVADFAEGLRRLLADPAAAEAMGRRGPAWVAANRRYDRIAADLLPLYEGLVKR